MHDPRAFGNYLRAERELRQIPLSEVAAATKIPLHTLQCLEGGEWDNLPADVFVKGFIRSYAKHLGLAPEEAFSRYTEIQRQRAEANRQPVAPVSEEPLLLGVGKRRFGLALFVIIILIIATITLSLIWRRGASADTHTLRDRPPPAATDTVFT
jgi:cytoskeletal protein RodZ